MALSYTCLTSKLLSLVPVTPQVALHFTCITSTAPSPLASPKMAPLYLLTSNSPLSYLHYLKWLALLLASTQMAISFTCLNSNGSIFYLPQLKWLYLLLVSTQMAIYFTFLTSNGYIFYLPHLKWLSLFKVDEPFSKRLHFGLNQIYNI